MNTVLDSFVTERVRTRLLARREELRQRLDHIHADQRRQAQPLSSDSADRVTQTQNDEVVDRIGTSAHAELVRIDEALWRVDVGQYGKCESCHHPIEAKRLEAVPYATRCLRCTSEPGMGLTDS